jgi:hypothetical protein
MNNIKTKQRAGLGAVVLDHLMRITLTGPTVEVFKEKVVGRVLKFFMLMKARQGKLLADNDAKALPAGCFEALFDDDA